MSSLSDTILTCFGCILGCLWLFLAGDEEGRNIDKNAYIIATGIRSTCARDISIGSTYATGTWIRCTGIGSTYTKGIYIKNAFVGDVKP